MQQAPLIEDLIDRLFRPGRADFPLGKGRHRGNCLLRAKIPLPCTPIGALQAGICRVSLGLCDVVDLVGTSQNRILEATLGNRSRRTKVSSAVRRRPTGPKVPDLSDILAHLADAIAFVRASQRSLNHLEVADDEESFLRKGLAALDAVYTEIALASIALYKQGRH